MNGSLLLFSMMSLATVATPGPTTLLALNHGARHGVTAALPGVVGAMLSDCVLIAAVATGLGGLIATSVTAFELLRWTGVAYLAWLGWRLMRMRDTSWPATKAPAEPIRKPQSGTVFRSSFTVAVTNPKGYLFFSALLPSFVDPAAPLLLQYALLAVVFAGIDGAVLLAYAMAGTASARRFSGTHTLHRIDRASGLTLLALAGGLAFWERG